MYTANSELTDVINGKVVRRDVPKIDWQDVVHEGSNFTYNGKPVFPSDYVWKDPSLDNDYLGKFDTSYVILNLLNDDKGNIDPAKLKAFEDKEETNVGFVTIQAPPLPQATVDAYPGIDEGKSLFTKYDIDNPEVRKMWSNAFKGLIPITAEKKYTELGYSLANEPHWFSGKGSWFVDKMGEGPVSEYTMVKFRNWLKQKHGNIDELNSLWKTDFSNFDTVKLDLPLDPIKVKSTPIWYDWCTFNMVRCTDWLKFLHDGVTSIDKDASTHIKIMPDLFTEEDRSHGIDFEKLTDMEEIIGDDAKIAKRKMYSTAPEDWESTYSYNWREVGMAYDFESSVSPNKAHINSENHFTSTSQYRDLDMTPQYVRSTYWFAAILGLDANYNWFWCRNADGSITDKALEGKGNPGYAGSISQQPLVANEASKTMMDMDAFSTEIVKFQEQKKPIRIFHSETSTMLKDDNMQNEFDLYESMYFNGVPIGFATKDIINKQPNSDWDVIVVRKEEYVTNDEFKTLQSYLNNGGTVIIDDSSLKYNEYKQARKESLTEGKGKLIKITDNTVKNMSTQAFDILSSKDELPQVTLTEKNGLDKKGCMWRVVKNKDNDYLMTVVNLGKNQANIDLKMYDNKGITVTDMLTGKKITSEFNLAPEGVLLLEITNNSNN
ncbi:beta-galactosidase [Clostridium sp.]